MTLYQTFQEASRVFFALQNARHHAAAGEFSDRRWWARRDPARHAMGVAWPQAPGRGGNAAGGMRIFTAGELAALSAGAAISALGRRPRRAGWHHHPRRID